MPVAIGGIRAVCSKEWGDTMTGEIYVGVDGSLAARAALEWASDRAAAVGGELVLVYVVDDEWGTVGSSARAELSGNAERVVEQELAFARAAAPHITARAMVAEGNPMLTMSALAPDAQLIVVGTHRTGYFRGRAFGSRSLQLAATATTPVAIIPQVPGRVRRGVALGIDPTAPSAVAIAFAANEAVRLRSDLTLLHSTWPKPLTEVFAHAAFDATLAAIREIAPSLAVRPRLVDVPAAEALTDLSRNMALVVAGRPRRHGAEDRGLGTVAHDLLLNQAGPVVMVPE
jgi:nucleotide-binding universal stress UspA family protein